MTITPRTSNGETVRRWTADHWPFELVVGNKVYDVHEDGAVYSLPYQRRGARVGPKCLGRIEVLWPFLFEELFGNRGENPHA